MEDNKRHKELDDLFSNLPLPDEDQAWQDMKKRLEKDDDDRFIVLPPFLQGCAGWTLLLALFLGGALWIYLRDTSDHKGALHKSRELRQEQLPEQKPAAPETPGNTARFKEKYRKELPGGVSESVTGAGEKEDNSFHTRSVKATAEKAEKSPLKGLGVSAQPVVVSPIAKKRTPHREVPALPSGAPLQELDRDAVVDTVSSSFDKPVAPDRATTATPDTASLQQPKSVADSVQSTPPKKENPAKNYHLALGMALQQQVPFAGQEWTPYNYRGRKGSLADYIPSLYLRLYREQKWFLQSEFKYGAPQYTKEFVYSKEVKTDTFGVRSSTSYRLKKTYYHQVPLSLHFQVRPSWSIGTGLIYNRFYGAVSDREQWKGTGAATDTLVSRELVLDKNESLFRSTNLQWLLETQYRWKSWSVGGRLAEGLQPYIEYVDEQGQEQRERNHSLQLFIRYELWSTKEK